MAKKGTPAQAAPSHAAQVGMNAHAAMQGASSRNSVSVVGGPMNFNGNSLAQQQDFTPRTYATKPNPKG